MKKHVARAMVMVSIFTVGMAMSGCGGGGGGSGKDAVSAPTTDTTQDTNQQGTQPTSPQAPGQQPQPEPTNIPPISPTNTTETPTTTPPTTAGPVNTPTATPEPVNTPTSPTTTPTPVSTPTPTTPTPTEPITTAPTTPQTQNPTPTTAPTNGTTETPTIEPPSQGTPQGAGKIHVTFSGNSMNVALPLDAQFLQSGALVPISFKSIKEFFWNDACVGWHSRGERALTATTYQSPTNIIISGINPGGVGNWSLVRRDDVEFYIDLSNLSANGVEYLIQDNLFYYGTAVMKDGSGKIVPNPRFTCQ